ncbi:MAG TPA: hypothetical protein VGJ15_13490 [Pirellulales bacterium]|jgi:hypothetical protein
MPTRPPFASSLILIALLLYVRDTAHTASAAPPGAQAPHAVDEAKVSAAGIRKLTSKRLDLYTDLPSSPEIDELPLVFDQAFPLWCKYFGVDSSKHDDFRMRASLIDDPAKFETSGLVPVDLPKFLNGYTRGRELWFNNQTSRYYRRHLLLHEGVHGFMFALVGDNGAPWYMEGIAELLGTHHWENGRLTLPYFPKQPSDVPKLGRIETVQTDFAKRKAKQVETVMAIDRQEFLHVEAYAWSWALCAFLDNHPRYAERFHKLLAEVSQPGDFNTKLKKIYSDDWGQLQEDWQAFIADLDHGYDFERTQIDFTPGKPLSAKSAALAGTPTSIAVKADRGWQDTGILLELGKKYELTATGKFQLAADPKPWISEPNGISIHYNHGKPLGLLLAAVRPIGSSSPISAFVKPIVVGTDTEITPTDSGTLYLKINDSAGALNDNSGQAEVTVREK